MVADRVNDRLAELGYNTRVVHRDIGKDEQRYKV
jgi:hypothetical protein